MGSVIGKNARKALAVFLSIVLVLGLNPALALADSGGLEGQMSREALVGPQGSGMTDDEQTSIQEELDNSTKETTTTSSDASVTNTSSTTVSVMSYNTFRLKDKGAWGPLSEDISASDARTIYLSAEFEGGVSAEDGYKATWTWTKDGVDSGKSITQTGDDLDTLKPSVGASPIAKIELKDVFSGVSNEDMAGRYVFTVKVYGINETVATYEFNPFNIFADSNIKTELTDEKTGVKVIGVFSPTSTLEATDLLFEDSAATKATLKTLKGSSDARDVMDAAYQLDIVNGTYFPNGDSSITRSVTIPASADLLSALPETNTGKQTLAIISLVDQMAKRTEYTLASLDTTDGSKVYTYTAGEGDNVSTLTITVPESGIAQATFTTNFTKDEAENTRLGAFAIAHQVEASEVFDVALSATNGTITGDTQVTKGSMPSYSLTSSEGYYLNTSDPNSVKVTATGATPTYTLTSDKLEFTSGVTSDITIQVTFTKFETPAGTDTFDLTIHGTGEGFAGSSAQVLYTELDADGNAKDTRTSADLAFQNADSTQAVNGIVAGTSVAMTFSGGKNAGDNYIVEAVYVYGADDHLDQLDLTTDAGKAAAAKFKVNMEGSSYVIPTMMQSTVNVLVVYAKGQQPQGATYKIVGSIDAGQHGTFGDGKKTYEATSTSSYASVTVVSDADYEIASVEYAKASRASDGTLEAEGEYVAEPAAVGKKSYTLIIPKVDSDYLVRATFKHVGYVLTIGSFTGGTMELSSGAGLNTGVQPISGQSAYTVPFAEGGTNVQFTVTPSGSYQFESMMEDGVLKSAADLGVTDVTKSFTYTVNVAKNMTVTPSFAPQKAGEVTNKVTVNVQASEGGTVSPTGLNELSATGKITLNFGKASGSAYVNYAVNTITVSRSTGGVALKTITYDQLADKWSWVFDANEFDASITSFIVYVSFAERTNANPTPPAPQKTTLTLTTSLGGGTIEPAGEYDSATGERKYVVNRGSEQNFDISASQDYAIDKLWLGIGEGGKLVDVTNKKDANGKPYFVPSGAGAGAGGTGTGATGGAGAGNMGASAVVTSGTLTFTPGESDESISIYIEFKKTNEESVLNKKFAVYTKVAGVADGATGTGSITPTGDSHSVMAGGEDTLTFKADSNSALTSVKVYKVVDGQAAGEGQEMISLVADSSLTLTINESVVVVATFSKIESGQPSTNPEVGTVAVQASVKASSNGQMGGTVNLTDTQAIYATPSASVSFTFTEKADYRLQNIVINAVKGTGGTKLIDNKTLSATQLDRSGKTYAYKFQLPSSAAEAANFADAQVTIEASFEYVPPTYTVTTEVAWAGDATTAPAGNYGFISPGAVLDASGNLAGAPAGVVTMATGTSQTFGFFSTDASKYEVKEVWLNNKQVAAKADSWLISGISADMTLRVVFGDVVAGTTPPSEQPESYTVTASVANSAQGSVSPTSYTRVHAGDSVSFTVTPAEGYRAATAIVNGNTSQPDVMNGNTYKLINVQENMSVSFTFEKVQTGGEGGSGGSGGEGDGDIITTPSSYYIFLELTGGGTVSPAGTLVANGKTAIEVPAGGTQTVTFVRSIPQEDGSTLSYKLESAYVVKGAVTSQLKDVGASYTFQDMESDVTLRVNYSSEPESKPENGSVTYKTHTVKTLVSGAGTVSPDPGVETSVAAGGSIGITVKADRGHQLSYIMVYDTLDVAADTPAQRITASQVQNNQYWMANIDSDKTVKAVFVTQEVASRGYTTYVTSTSNKASGDDVVRGYVNPAGTIAVLEPVEGDADTSVALGIWPYFGSKVDTVTEQKQGASESSRIRVASSGGQTDLEYQGSEVYAVNAVFDADTQAPNPGTDETPEYVVSAKVEGVGGSISPAKTQVLPQGSSQTFTLIPDDGYVIDTVRANGSPVGLNGKNSFTANNINGNLSIVATFVTEKQAADQGGTEVGEVEVKKPHSVKASIVGPGSVTPMSAKVADGESVTLHMAPSSGAKFASLVVDGQDVTASVDATLTYTTGAITKDTDVIATFTNEKGNVPFQSENVNVDVDVAVEVDVDLGVDVDSGSGAGQGSGQGSSQGGVVDSGKGGKVSPDGTISIPYGSDYTFKLMPNDGYYVASVTSETNEISTSYDAEYLDGSGKQVLPSEFKSRARSGAAIPAGAVSGAAEQAGALTAAEQTDASKAPAKALRNIGAPAGNAGISGQADGDSEGLSYLKVTVKNITENITLKVRFAEAPDDLKDVYVYDKESVKEVSAGSSGGAQVQPEDVVLAPGEKADVTIGAVGGETVKEVEAFGQKVELVDTDDDGKPDKAIYYEDPTDPTKPGEGPMDIQEALDKFNQAVEADPNYNYSPNLKYDEATGTFDVTLSTVDKDGNPVKGSLDVIAGGTGKDSVVFQHKVQEVFASHNNKRGTVEVVGFGKVEGTSIDSGEAYEENGRTHFDMVHNGTIIVASTPNTGYELSNYSILDSSGKVVDTVQPTPVSSTQTRSTGIGMYAMRAASAVDRTAIQVSDDCDIRANFGITQYDITYNLAGGSVAKANPTAYNIESASFTLNNPTRTGYTFAGWTGTGLSGATKDVTVPAGSIGNRAYTATWTATGTQEPGDGSGQEPGQNAGQNNGEKPGQNAGTIPGTDYPANYNKDSMYIVRASVDGQGTVSPSGTVAFSTNENAVFTLKAKAGYQLTAVIVDGVQQSWSADKFTIAAQKAGTEHTLVAVFKASLPAGNNDGGTRLVRTLTSLAQTGDLAVPGILVLATIGCGALGVAILINGRRRKVSDK